MHEELSGRLIPKAMGEDPEQYAYSGNKNRYGNMAYGKSKNNSADRHNDNSEDNHTSWISTSRSFDVAKECALHLACVKIDGYSYKIDTSLFEKYNVITFDSNEDMAAPTDLKEYEVLIHAEDYGEVPREVIGEVIPVSL